MKLKTRLYSGALALCVLVSFTQTANALIFRKCNYKIMVSANGYPHFELPNSGMSPWARGPESKKEKINQWLENEAAECAFLHSLYDGTKPHKCHLQNPKVHYDVRGTGISGFSLYRGFLHLRKEICQRYRPRQGVNTGSEDIRSYDGFNLYIKSSGGSGRCRSRNFLQGAARNSTPTFLTLACRSKAPFKHQNGKGTRWLYHPSYWSQFDALLAGKPLAPAEPEGPPDVAKGQCYPNYVSKVVGKNRTKTAIQAQKLWIQNVTRKYGKALASRSKARNASVTCKRTSSNNHYCRAEGKPCPGFRTIQKN